MPPASGREPRRGSIVPTSRDSLAVGPHYPPGYFVRCKAGHQTRCPRRDRAGLSRRGRFPMPVLGQAREPRWACLLFRRFRREFVFLPVASRAGWDSPLGSGGPPFRPASGIDGQSLPRGQCCLLCTRRWAFHPHGEVSYTASPPCRRPRPHGRFRRTSRTINRVILDGV